MRKSVKNGPLPDADAATHAQGGEKADVEMIAGASRNRVEGGSGAVASAKSPTAGLVPGTVGPDDESNLNDAWLVEWARHGDHAAFAVLVRRYERKLIRVLARLVRDPELARDLAQETFWRVYTRLDRFDTARRFGPWLFRVGVNLGLDQIRRSRNELSPPTSIDRPHGEGRLPFEVPDPDPRIQEDLAQEVQFILAQMPVSYRAILVLRDLEGFSSSEVAAIVGRREATIRWRLSKARDKFREIWQRRQDGTQQEAKDGSQR
jgi:RNA polymerase sigma-70 factor (ECF subfamily)